MQTLTKDTAQATAVTPDDGHYFFGYYDKCPWDATGRYILAQKSPFRDRNPGPDDPLILGVIDTAEANRFQPFATTRAWNWQQGCMLRWRPPDFQQRVLFNAVQDGRYVCCDYDLASGSERQWPWPFYDVSYDGRLAASLNFARITETRPGYGYFGAEDPHREQACPNEDGLHLIDLEQGRARLVVSIAEAAAVGRLGPPQGHKAWFNHATFSPAGQRVMFLQRSAPQAVSGHAGFLTRLFVIDADGSNLRCVLEGVKISHFDWFDEDRLIIWLESLEHRWQGYQLVDVNTAKRVMFANGVFPSDGHCVLSPDRRWMATDTYPQGAQRKQPLFLYEMSSGIRHDLGAFSAMTVPDASMRCDLHTRWNRAGDKLCFDSTHEGRRAMYVIDITPWLENVAAPETSIASRVEGGPTA